MKNKFTKLMAALALLTCLIPLTGWGQTKDDPTVLFHETFGNNPNSAREWKDEYSVKSGVETVYSGITSYTVSNVKQGKNTTGQTLSGLNQSANNTDAYIIIGPLNVSDYESMSVTYYWKPGSTSGTYYRKLYYATSENGTYDEITRTSGNVSASAFNLQTYALPEEAQVQTLYLKVLWKTSNTQGIIDEFELTGIASGGSSTPSITIPEEELSLGYEENADGTFHVSYTNFTATSAYATLYSDPECENPFPTTGDDAWIVIDNTLSNPYNAIGYTLVANPNTTPRTVYLQIYAYEANYSNYLDGTFEITQAGMPAPAPYINLVADAAVYTPVDAYHMEFSYNVSGGGPIDNVEYGNFQSTLEFDNFDIQFCDVNGDPLPTQAAPDWFMNDSPKVVFYEPDNTISLYVEVLQNETANDRYCYFKVYAANGNEWVYSDLVTVHQTGMPQVATPTFSPGAGKVEAGTTVAISCDTEGAAILYSTDGVNYNAYSAPIAINEAITLYAKATKDNYVTSEVATAQYTIAGNAVFEDGVYSETMTTSGSFENMEVVNVTGDGTWVYNTNYNCAFVKCSNAQEDWLITPRMAVDNGKLLASFQIYHKNLEQNGIALKWSSSSSISGTWQDVEFEKGSASGWRDVNNLVIETGNAENIYLAFVYKNVNAANAQCQIRNLTVRQYYNVTFNANNTEATGTMTALSCAAGVATALTDNVFAVAGKVFNGWNTQPDGQGDAYADGANITITNNTTLYAQWVDLYKVKFTTNGIEDVVMEVTQGQAIGTLPTATAEYIPAGYAFMGWLDYEYQVSNDAPNAYISTDYEPQGDVTLYAVFAEVTASQSAENYNVVLVDTDITSGSGYHTGTFSKSNIDFSFKDCLRSSGYIQMKASTGELHNTTSAGDYISSISIDAKLNGDKVVVYEGETLNNCNTQITGNNNVYTFSGNTTYFKVTNNGTYTQVKITVNYVKTIESYTYSNYRTSLTESCDLTINGYNNDDDKNGYYLIASPVYVDPAMVEGMTTEDFDLYYFDEAQGYEEWRNYEASNFNLVPGKGYLYAKKIAGATSTYNFTLTGAPYNGNGSVELAYTTGNQLAGWNLIGNPYANAALLKDDTQGDRAYYKMNDDGDDFEAVNNGATIAAMTGVFVYTETDGETVTFVEQQPSGANNSNSSQQLSLNVSMNRGTTIDRAFVNFGNGSQLPKLQLNPRHTKVYFEQGNRDYAVVNSANEGEMPVNFKAENNGTYTLSVNAENVGMTYLHLIDNMTGADIDLLATPSYSFEAKTTDYASRFRLVFSGSSTSSETAETFAYYNGSEWVINNMGDATLQVVDVMGRVLSSETVSGNATLSTSNLSAGVYVMRLINGENAMMQKIVVR